MAIKHNQQIQKNHFRKDWQRRVRVHLDQPGRKLRRRQARAKKAATLAPRPVDRLRPVVRCPTIRHNHRLRLGRGFSFTELKEAGIPRKLAPTIGIAVDKRRKNLSEESIARNVARLKDYTSRVIVFPRRNGKQKAGDAPPDIVKAAKAGTGKIAREINVIIPVENIAKIEEMKVSEAAKNGEENAYRRLRIARSDARLAGVREKRAKLKAEEAAATKK